MKKWVIIYEIAGTKFVELVDESSFTERVSYLRNGEVREVTNDFTETKEG